MTQAVVCEAVPACGADEAFSLALPQGAAGQWCSLAVALPACATWWAKVEATDLARGQVVRSAFLGRRRGQRRSLLMHVPFQATQLVLTLLHAGGTSAGNGAPGMTLRVLGRRQAALRLVLAGWRKLPACLRGGPSGLAGRIRVELGQAPARAGEAPPYADWVRRYDAWGAAERAALTQATSGPCRIEVLVLGRAAQGEFGHRLSAESLARQWRPPDRVSHAAACDGFARLPGAWLLVLRAGDVLADQALACFALAAQAAPDAPGFYADVDRLEAGRRAAPLFKPQSDPWLRRGPLLSQGACLLHPDAPLADGANPLGVLPGEPCRIPFILTHAARVAPAAASAAAPVLAASQPHVSIVVATSGRAPHVLPCLRGVLATTAYTRFDVTLAVSRVYPEDKVQRRVLAAAAALERVRVLDFGMDGFNYAAVNNAAVRATGGDLLLLLNDDVTPIRPDWLARMVAPTLGDGAVVADMVGARLLYAHGHVQHAGVIMGLAHLCEHAFRLAARDDAGPYGLALAERQVSAVTGACMLVRRSLWEALGGMDEGFTVALNDVDVCLRAGARGARVVLAADAALFHYEGRSLGRHYQGARARLEILEVQRLRARWQSLIADDPFYNPQASLEPGREFQPAFPPRLTPLSWIGHRNAALR